jgi:hypothetical protein
VLEGDPLDILHHGQPATISDKELTLDIPAPVQLTPPTQPYGRVPQPHRARASLTATPSDYPERNRLTLSGNSLPWPAGTREPA